MSRQLEAGFVAVHAGAGYHPLVTRAATLRICKEACKRAYDVLVENKSESSAVEACVAATIVLEDDPITNAGIGSNLTTEEKVECDAGLMEGQKMLFAGAGCVRNVKNPISVCRKLLEMHNDEKRDGTSLVPPTLLAGDGATAFARKFGLDNVPDDDLITKRSLTGYRKALETVAEATGKRKQKKGLSDTVGVIVVDSRGRVAASCSSGGPLLKLPGRIGHSAQFGCGVWAEERPLPQSSDLSSIAISCTGCGEYLTRTSLAKTIGQRIYNQRACDANNGVQTIVDTLGRSLREDYLESFVLKGMDETRKIAGAIVLKTEVISKTELLVDFAYGHRSASMCLAYLTPDAKEPNGVSVRCKMSECSENSKVVASGGLYRLKVSVDDDADME